MIRSILSLLLVLFFTTDCVVKKKIPIPLFDGDGGGSPTSGATVGKGIVITPSSTANLVSISVSPANASIPIGTSQYFKATGIYSDGTTLDITTQVTWNSSDPSKATVGSTSGKAVGVAEGNNINIVATLGTVSGTGSVNISAATLTSVIIQNVPNIATGGTYQLKAIGTFSDGTTKDITADINWSSNLPDRATISNNDANKGLLSGVSAGTATITATINGQTYTRDVNITSATLASISISPSATIVLGSTRSFIATGTYSDGSTLDITSLVNWSSSNSATSTIQSNGVATAVSAGTTSITASFGGVTSSPSTLTITAPSLTSIAIVPILSSQSSTIPAGSIIGYKAMGTFSDGFQQDLTAYVSWGSTSSSVATVGNGSTYGGVVNTIAGGMTNITASLNGITSPAYSINVPAATTLVSISVTPGAGSVAKGLTQQFVATGTFSDGSTQVLTTQVAWSSNSAATSIGTNTGLATAANTGSSTISATYNGITGTANLTVTSATLQSISITPINQSINKGGSLAYTATGIYSDNSTQNITNDSGLTWSVSNATVSIDNTTGVNKGKLSTSAGTAVGGPYTVTASKGGVSGTTNISIGAATITQINITGPTSGAKGSSVQFTATAVYSDGTTLDITNLATWKSDSNSDSVNDNTVVTMNTTNGNASSNASSTVGPTNIQVTYGGVTGSYAFTLTPATLNSIAITPATPSIAKGLTQQFVATGTYSDGSTQILTNDTNLSWTSNSAAVSISNTTGTKGLGTGANVGTSTVSATYSGFSGTITPATMEVTSAILQAIAVTPSPASVSVNLTQQMIATGTYSDGSTQNITTNVAWKSDSNSDGIDDQTIAAVNNAVNKGLVTGVATGTSSITASSGAVVSTPVTLTVSASTTNTTTVGNYNVTIPTGVNTTTPPSGNFTGTTYNTSNNAAGFISVIPDYTTNPNTCQAQGTAILGKILADTPDLVTASDQVSSNTTNFTGGCTITYYLSVTTNANKTATQLSDHLITNIGVNTVGGTVTNLPTSQGTEVATTSFRAIVQVTYSTGTGNQIIGVGVTNSADYAANQALLESFLGGTNVAPQGTTYLTKADTFTATPDPEVDFVWVVDNSGSMTEEQASVANNSLTFFNKLNGKHLNFRLAVITTGNKTDTSDNLPTYNGQDLLGTGWTTSADGDSAFQSNVNKAGIKGSGEESGLYYAEKALGGATGTGTKTVVKRANSKLIFVILSDEGDQYECKANSGVSPVDTADPCLASTRTKKFNPNDNIIKNNNHKVYAIIGLDAATGQPGVCEGSGTKAQNANNGWSRYYDVALATGGSSATICTTDYSSILDNIATQAAGSASTYILSKNPQSTSIVVKVNGVTVSQDSTNGWQYNAASNSIVFSGTAWPTAGAAIEVSYQYSSEQGAFNIPKNGKQASSLMASLIGSRFSSVGMSFLIVFGIAAWGYLIARFIKK